MDARSSTWVEVELLSESSFNRTRETLERVGVQNEEPDKDGKFVLNQVCYIFFKGMRYYITHIKEMKAYDGEIIDISEEDIAIRNFIVHLLIEWNILDVIDPRTIRSPVASSRQVRVLSYHEARVSGAWKLVSDYQIGKFRRRDRDDYSEDDYS